MLDDSVPFQLLIWGHAYTGDVTEPGALTAEKRRGDLSPRSDRLFDLRGGHMGSAWVDEGDGRGWRRPPLWWCLPWVGEHIRRGHEDHP